jgi:phage recombination protein Bet
LQDMQLYLVNRAFLDRSTMPYTDSELKAIRAEYAKGSTDEQFTNFIREVETRKLIPGRHVYFQLRSQSKKDENGNWIKENRPIHMSSIDALRLIAQRTGEYQGQSAPLYIYLDANGYPSIKSEIMLPDSDNRDLPARPYAVQVSVFRKNFAQSLTATARFEAYAQTKYNGGLVDMWERRGPEQLAKCAEALALRQAFPEEIGGLYLAEELRDDPETGEVPSEPIKTTKKKDVKNVDISIGTDRSSGVLDSTGPAAELARPVTTREDIVSWAKKLKALGVEKNRILGYVERKYKVSKTTELTQDQLADIIAACMNAREKGLEELNKMLDG